MRGAHLCQLITLFFSAKAANQLPPCGGEMKWSSSSSLRRQKQMSTHLTLSVISPSLFLLQQSYCDPIPFHPTVSLHILRRTKTVARTLARTTPAVCHFDVAK
uniref:Secreted protein n=1 Tax=Anguilla anguilla TaxID=7936 RepID=A0A0E9X7V1_ANGAN